MGLVYEMRIEDAVQKQNITESTHTSLLIAHRLLKVYRAMEVVLVDAVDEDVLGITTEEEECHRT